jgi:hypothetical protein
MHIRKWPKWGVGKDILLFRFTRRILFFIELHNTTQMLTIRTHNLYEYTYVNPILKSTSEGLNTRQIWRFPEVTIGAWSSIGAPLTT